MPDDIHQRISALSPAKRALLERVRAQRAGAAPPRLADRQIAVIGMDCRFPSGPDPAAFWALLSEGVDAIRPVPPQRWDTEELYDPAFDAAGKVATRWGGFLDQIDLFDSIPFGISPREAAMLDPQHRLLLEVVWHAIEDAGLTKQQLAGSQCGVFASVYQRDYAHLALADEKGIDAYTASGTHHSIAAGRISYLFDLRGPSLVVDTACSSSLVAVHLACRSLLAAESDMAIVASANLMLSPAETMSLSRWGMMAADGRCKPFDARADGFVRGEGAGALILKRLDAAQQDGDPIYATIAGSAISQDGRSHGLTAPNGLAQQAVIRAALKDAGLEPAAVSYVEAHGTGTSLGDPIEMEALRAVYDAASADAPGCAVGSVKSNIGHLEASAGMAGIIKSILCLQHERIVPSLHLRELNPAIDLQGSRLSIATEVSAWTGDRVAAVSSFGMGGTNAHVLLRSAPEPESPPSPSQQPAPSPSQQPELSSKQSITSASGGLLLAISACSKGALLALVQSYAQLLPEAAAHSSELPEQAQIQNAPARLCAAAGQRRSHHHLRLGVAADDNEMLRFELEQLTAPGAIEQRIERAEARRAARRDRAVVMLFPGQGSQWRGMSRALLARYEPFRDSLHRCDAIVREQSGWSLLDELARPGDRFEAIEVVQPLLFAYQVALVELYKSWGIEPHMVIGHSMGEAAAAYACGALSLSDALSVILRRTALMRRVRGRGAMLVVPEPAGVTEQLLTELCEGAAPPSVAAINGPSATVVSGERVAVESFAAALADRGIDTRTIAVDVASHSAMVDGLAAELTEALTTLSPQPSRIPMLSTVDGRQLSGTELGATYWHRNLRRPVQLWPTVRPLLSQHPILIEVSPHPILLSTLAEAPQAASAVLLPSCRREREGGTLMHSLAQLYELGLTLSWSAVDKPVRGQVALPRYPFERVRHWLPQRAARVSRGHNHPLLGSRTDSPEASRYSGAIELSDAAFLRDHLVEGNCVVPGMGSIDMVCFALQQADRSATLADIRFERPIVIEASEELSLQLELREDQFVIWGLSDHGWVRHNHGRVLPMGSSAAEASPADAKPIDIEATKQRMGEARDGAAFYQRLNASGNHWGAAFQGVAQTYLGDGEVLAELHVPESIAAELGRYAFHPAFLDACGQPMFELVEDEQRGPVVLASIASFRLHGSAQKARYSYIRIAAEQVPGSLTADVLVLDAQGHVLVEVGGLRIQFLHEVAEHWFYQRSWRRTPLSSETLSGESGPTGAAPRDGLPTGPVPKAGLPTGPVPKAGYPSEALPDGKWLIIGEGLYAQALQDKLSRRSTEDVSLLSFDDPLPEQGHDHVLLLAPEVSEQETVAARQRRIAAACMRLIDVTRGKADRAQIWLLSRGASLHPSGEVRPWQAPLWGLAQVARAEHPGLLRRAIDLDPAYSPQEAADAAVAELCLPDDEPTVALREATRWLPRLTRASRPRPPPGWRLRPDASYLISGGLGGLGAEVARRLVERGARHLLLLSRTPLPPRERWHEPSSAEQAERIERVMQLEQLGAAVHIAAVDVADDAALSTLAQAWRKSRRPPVAGIIHAAGIQERRVLSQLDAAALSRELAAKVAGTENLWRAWGEQLELFVGFSSAATLLPSPLLGSYTAANAFLDAFAEAKRRQGAPATAISWGVWAAAGMAERYERSHGRTVVGMQRMSADRALDAMEQAHMSGLGHIGVMALDPEAWRARAQHDASEPYLSELSGGHGAQAEAAAQPGGAPLDLAAKLAEASGELRREILSMYLLQALSQILRTSPDALEQHRPLTALGVDSLMALELRNRIRHDSGASVGVVDILRSHSFTALVTLLAEQLSTPPSEGQTPLDDVDELVI